MIAYAIRMRGQAEHFLSGNFILNQDDGLAFRQWASRKLQILLVSANRTFGFHRF